MVVGAVIFLRNTDDTDRTDIVFFQTNFNFKQGILLSNLNISFQDFQTT